MIDGRIVATDENGTTVVRIDVLDSTEYEIVIGPTGVRCLRSFLFFVSCAGAASGMDRGGGSYPRRNTGRTTGLDESPHTPHLWGHAPIAQTPRL
jgi:hypothetical protein